MYRIFYQGKYQGEVNHYPWLSDLCFPAFVFYEEVQKWTIQRDYRTYPINPEEVPKEYLVLNLLL